MNKKLQLLIALLLTLPLWTWAAGTTWQTATPLKLGTSVTAPMTSDEGEHWYKVDVPENGALTIRTTPSSGLSVRYTSVNVVNSSQECMERAFAYVYTESKDFTVPDCAKGTYYIKVYRQEGQGTYTLRCDLTPTSATYADDTEPNDQWQQARQLKRGTTGSGHLGYYYLSEAKDETDWWKIDVPRDGTIKLWWAPSGNLSIRYVALHVIDTNGEAHERTYKYSYTEQQEMEIPDAKAGTYYVEVKHQEGQGAYRLQYRFEQNNYANDAEPNNDIANAAPLQKGATVAGHLGYVYHNDRDEDDYYRLTVTQRGTVEFNIRPLGDLSVRYIALHDAQGYERNYVYVYQEAGKLTVEDVSAGTYYLRVHRESGQGTYLLCYGSSIGTVKQLDPLPDETADDPNKQPLPSDGTGTEYTYNPVTNTVYIEKTSQTAPYIIACGPFGIGTPLKEVLIAPDIFKGLPPGDVNVGTKIPPVVTGDDFDGGDVGSRILHVPNGSKPAYEKAPGWCLFGTIVDDYDTKIGQPSGPRLIVWLKNGDKVTYELADAPVTTFTGSQLVIRTNKATIPYDRKSVLRYTYEDVVDKGVELMPGERRIQINRERDEVVFRGLPVGSKACIYSVNGMLVEQRQVTDSQPLTLSLKNRPDGVYIVKAGTETIKLMKQ